jgi:co-chaperonin GroES (HSP10)
MVKKISYKWDVDICAQIDALSGYIDSIILSEGVMQAKVSMKGKSQLSELILAEISKMANNNLPIRDVASCHISNTNKGIVINNRLKSSNQICYIINVGPRGGIKHVGSEDNYVSYNKGDILMFGSDDKFMESSIMIMPIDKVKGCRFVHVMCTV